MYPTDAELREALQDRIFDLECEFDQDSAWFQSVLKDYASVGWQSLQVRRKQREEPDESDS